MKKTIYIMKDIMFQKIIHKIAPKDLHLQTIKLIKITIKYITVNIILSINHKKIVITDLYII